MLRRSTLAALTAASAAALLALPGLPAQAAPRFSSAELGAAKSTIDARLTEPPAGVTSWGVDPVTQRVTVSVLKGDAAALQAARRATAGLASAKIVTVTEKVRPLYSLVGGQAIYGSGGGRCSIGFSGTKGNARYVITAGHCTKLGGTWTGYNRVPIGPVDSTAFPTDDFGTIAVTNAGSWSNTALVAGPTSTTSVSVYGSTEAYIGTAVCRSGSTTGWHCGVIQARNQTVNYGGGNVIYGLTRTSACAEPGDSGGSFVSSVAGTGGQAQGLTSGGSGNCSSGGTTYFQPIDEVLSRTGITLTTTAPTTVLCSNANYGGTCHSYTDQQVPDLRVYGTNPNRNDSTTSLRIPSFRYLAVWKDVNYTGACSYFGTDRADMTGTAVGNDQASSFQVLTAPPANCTAG